MNKKLIFIGIIFLIASPLTADADFRRGKNGQWYTYDTRTGMRKEIFSNKNISDPNYWERRYPYQKKSDYTTFGSDRTYIDQTNRDMGNNR